MASLGDCPLLFLDVDGPLIPFRARPAGPTLALGDVAGSADASGNPLIERLDPADGHRLLALGCQLVWATTWMADANEIVAPRLGLPELPVVEFPDGDEESEHRLHWKTRFLTQWPGRRPFHPARRRGARRVGGSAEDRTFVRQRQMRQRTSFIRGAEVIVKPTFS